MNKIKCKKLFNYAFSNVLGIARNYKLCVSPRPLLLVQNQNEILRSLTEHAVHSPRL